MTRQAKQRLITAFLTGLAVISTSCLPGFRVEQEEVSACAQEQVTLLEPGWEVIWSARIEDGYVSKPPFVAGDYLIVTDRTIGRRSRPRIRTYQISSGQEVWVSSDVEVGALSLQTLAFTREYVATHAFNSTSVLRVDSGETVLELDGLWVFSLALDEERLYVHDYSGNFRAYNLPTGELAWERQLPEATRNSDLFVTQGRLVVDLLEGLWLLDTESGQIINHLPPDRSSSRTAHPGLYEDTFLVGEEGVGLVFLQAVSLETGELLWREKYRPFITYEPPAHSGGVLYLPGGGFTREGAEQVLAVKLESGELVWSYQPGEGVGVLSGVAISNETRYAVFSDGTLRAVDLETGEASIILRSDTLYYWATDDAKYFSAPGVAACDDYLFVSFGCRTVYALRMPEGDGE